MNDIFGPGSNVGRRFVENYEEVTRRVEAARGLGFKITLTSGTWDLLHIGQCRYLEAAKNAAGDPNTTLLVVGIDCDERVRTRKGKHRPIVPEGERLEMICHQRHVDLVTLKRHNEPKHCLIHAVRPDVLITTERLGRDDAELAELNKYCGEIRVLESQAPTSTTGKIRLILVDLSANMKEKFLALSERIKTDLDKFNEFIDHVTGDDK